MATTSNLDPAQPLWDRVDPNNLAIINPFKAQRPVQIGAMANALGLQVISQTLSSNISGLINLRDDGIYEIQINNTDAPVRQRFTVAHEIAHFLLHQELIGKEGIEDSILYRSKLSNRQEAEANRLAAALLLPWEEVRKWHLEQFGHEPNRDKIDQVASAFSTSSLAAGFRLGV